MEVPSPSGPVWDAGVSSVGELVDLVRERRGREPRFLFMAPEDLRDPATVELDTAAFPTALPIENRALPLNYAYKPGQADDGVTLEVSVREAEALTPAALDWAVPGHVEAKVEHYLRALPKELRRGFVPLAETAKALAAAVAQRDRLTGRRETITEALAAEIAERYRIALDPAVWQDKPLPEHLRVRVRVIDATGREVCASRELVEVRAALAAQSRDASLAVAREEPAAWRAARAKWETAEHTHWNFEPWPERVLVTEQGGAPVYAFPGLRAGQDGVARRLFRTPEEAGEATREAVRWLLDRQLGHDLGWTERDLRALKHLGPLAAMVAPMEELQQQTFAAVRRWVTDPARALVNQEGIAVANAASFAAAVERGKADLRGLVPRLVDLFREILTLRSELLVMKDAPADLVTEVTALVPADFAGRTPLPQWWHLPRYLKAKKLRAERWRKNPAKDAERAAQILPFVSAWRKMQAESEAAGASDPNRTTRRSSLQGGEPDGPASTGSRKGFPDTATRRSSSRGGEMDGPTPSVPAAALAARHRRERLEALRRLIEEFRVSLFAQELGTAEPVSAVKLERALAELRGAGAGEKAAPPEASAKPAPKPIVAAPIAEKKTAPIKNLGALDKLFRH